MRIWAWLVVGVLGFGLMSAAYFTREQPDPQSVWAYGFIAMGPAPEAAHLDAHATAVRLRLLPAGERAEALLKVGKTALGDTAATLDAQLRPKLILIPFEPSGLNASSLESGRLPVPGADEVLAGPQTSVSDRVVVGDHSLQVVGRLKRADYAVFADSFLVPPPDASNRLLPDDDPAVHSATAVPVPAAEAHDRKLAEKRSNDFPPPKYTIIAPPERLDPRAYYLYLAGLAVMLLGGSGALIGLYNRAADWSRRRGLAGKTDTTADWSELEETSSAPPRKRPSWLASPLFELQGRPRLVWGVHLVYFGLVIAGSIFIYEFPDIQAFFLAAVGKALSEPKGPLGAAGQAYASGNIPRAALVTFVVNFFLGSILSITLPSIIVPGLGVLMAVLRSLAWGVILAPTIVVLAGRMLPHSLVMLLEGEGYILATIFGLLIPIHIVQSSLGGNPLSRFGRVLSLNLAAVLLVALVLVVAACYEATEVILMNG